MWEHGDKTLKQAELNKQTGEYLKYQQLVITKTNHGETRKMEVTETTNNSVKKNKK
jgi:hypothetical protein